MVGEMETKEKPKPTPDYLMQLMNDKKLMSSLPNFCGIFNHLERLLDEGESPRRSPEAPLPGARHPPARGGGGGRREDRGWRGPCAWARRGPGGALGGGAGAGLVGRGGGGRSSRARLPGESAGLPERSPASHPLAPPAPEGHRPRDGP